MIGSPVSNGKSFITCGLVIVKSIDRSTIITLQRVALWGHKLLEWCSKMVPIKYIRVTNSQSAPGQLGQKTIKIHIFSANSSSRSRAIPLFVPQKLYQFWDSTTPFLACYTQSKDFICLLFSLSVDFRVYINHKNQHWLPLDSRHCGANLSSKMKICRFRLI